MLSATARRQQKQTRKRVRREKARPFAYLCRDESKPPGDEIGEVSPRKSAAVAQIRSYRPHAHSPLINCACSYVPSTDATSRPTVSSSRRRFTSPKKLPQKARLPLLTAGRKVTPTRFLSGKETGHRAYYGPGVRRLGPQGFRQPPQGNRVRDDYGRAYTRPRPKQAKRLGRPVSCPRPAGKSPNGIPP